MSPGDPDFSSEAWADVSPILLEEGAKPVVAIQYGDADREVLSYFQAIANAGELSRRALALTEMVINVNSASYPAWRYRWQCLEALADESLLQQESSFLERVAASNSKNYQLWNHRRLLAFKLGPKYAQEELEFAANCLDGDSKNYHAWSHRQAIVEQFDLWEEELSYVCAMIAADVRNNSAWNQRFCIVSSAPGLGKMEECVEKEVQYTIEQIRRAPRNESAWSYLQGLSLLAGGDDLLVYSSPLHAICKEMLEEDASCGPALAMLGEVYAAQARAATADNDVAAGELTAGLAARCFDGLRVADPMRAAYWTHRTKWLEEPTRIR